MMVKKMKKVLSMVLVMCMVMGLFSMTAAAADEEYVPTDTYVLNYDGEYDGPKWQYFSPYWAAWKYNGSSDYEAVISFSLYNTVTKAASWVYCTDIATGLRTDSYFRRINLEDSTYHAVGSSGKLRSIVLQGFPSVSADALGKVAGVEGLTVGEAVSATQLAIWKVTHGDLVEFTDYCYYIDTEWSSSATLHFDECMAEIKNAYAVDSNENTIEEHIKTVYEYLIGLSPSPKTSTAVSENSFQSWSEKPILRQNEDGTYDITVAGNVYVELTDADSMMLSAVMSDRAYYTSTPLINGNQFVTLTIKNVPAESANGAITLAIDGTQTASDVFLFDAVGDRGASQSLIGKDSSQLPVHAEITISPEFELPDAGGPVALRLVKKGQGGEPVQGAKFDVYARIPAVNAAGTTSTMEIKLAENLATDAGGKITVQLSSLSGDATYFFREVAAAPGYELGSSTDYTVNVATSTTEEIDGKNCTVYTANATNALDMCGLTLKKTVEGTSTDEKFTFTVTLDLSTAELLGTTADLTAAQKAEKVLTAMGKTEPFNTFDLSGVTFTAGESDPCIYTATVELAHDESKTIETLPAGVTYSVTEEDSGKYTVSGEVEHGKLTDNVTVKVVNTHETVNVTVNKEWGIGTAGKEQPVTVRLYADGEQYGEAVTLNSPNWTYTWTELDKYSISGDEIVYTVTEDEIGENWYQSIGKEKTDNGYVYTIKNTYFYYEPATTSVTVVKEWVDNDDAQGLRPDSIQVELMKNGKATGNKATLSEKNGWTHTWTGLDKDAEWSAQELNVPGDYEVDVEVSGTTVTITNTLPEPEPTPTPTPTPTPEVPSTPSAPSDDPSIDIPDDEPPTSDIPVDDPSIDIPDDEPPTSDIPKTGDNSGIWLALAALAACGLAVLTIVDKKRKNID